MKQAAQSTHQTRNTMSGGCITLDAFVEQGQALARDDPAYTWRTVKGRISTNRGFLTCRREHCFHDSRDTGGDGEDAAITSSHAFADDDDDGSAEVTAPCPDSTVVIITYHVCFEPSYSVPGVYFEAHRQDGVPLRLDEIYKLVEQLSHNGPSVRAAAYEAITQQEHPLLQHPCWQVHPCKTKDVLAQVCASPPNATADDDDDDDDGADADVLAGDDPGEDDAEATLAADHSTQQREQPSRQHSYLEAFISTIGRLVGMPQPQPQRHRPPA